MKKDKLLRLTEIIDVLPVSEATARRLIRRGVIPAVRVGRQIFVSEDRLRQWIANGGSGVSALR